MSKAVSEVRPVGHPLDAIQAVRVLKIHEVCAITGLSRASVYRLAALGSDYFPAPIKTGIRASGWRLPDLEAWLASRQTGIRLAA